MPEGLPKHRAEGAQILHNGTRGWLVRASCPLGMLAPLPGCPLPRGPPANLLGVHTPWNVLSCPQQQLEDWALWETGLRTSSPVSPKVVGF